MPGLTSLFGMGRGEHRLHNHQNNGFDIWTRHIREIECVIVSLRYCVSDLTAQATHALTHSHIKAITTESLRVISTARL